MRKTLMMLAMWALGAGSALAEDVPDYLSFTAQGGDVTIGMAWSGDVTVTPTTTHTFEWSTDKTAENWTEFVAGWNRVMTVHADETVYFRRKGEAVTTLNPNSGDDCWWQFFMFPEDTGATIAAGGNVISLLDATCEQTEVGAKAFAHLFESCTVLTAAPKLPATTLAESCYENMFFYCTSLTVAPELPATTLAKSCYENMFSYCETLTVAPNLPAETLAESCYENMFYFCTSLAVVPGLPATTLAESCYNQMFAYCTSLAVVPELPATTLAKSCYENMFYYCTSLAVAPNLPATTLAESCYENMFSYCTSLAVVPKTLPATTLAKSCYENMFSYCETLTVAPNLPATTLAESCYENMFYFCTSLAVVPNLLPATTLAKSCYENMFYYCTSLTVAPNLPATTLAERCYYSMFAYCTSLTVAPNLPATTLAENCYSYMFDGCTSLGWIEVGFTEWGNGLVTQYWVYQVPAGGMFVCPSGLQEKWGSDNIPNGWTKAASDSVCFVTVPKVEHLQTTVTMDGKAVTPLKYADNTRWPVLKNEKVQVAFAVDEECVVEGTTSYTIDPMTADVTFGTTEGYPLPEVVRLWQVGDKVTAYVSDENTLVIGGTGAMDDFASAESVPWYAVAGGIEAVTIAEGVTSIGNHAFDGCTALTSVTVLAVNPPTAGDDMFTNCQNLTAIYVPAGCVDAYKATDGWENYADKIMSIWQKTLPEGYKEVDYIVAPRNSYINTGYKPNQDTRVAMDVTVQGAREYWFGAWNIDWDNGAYALGNDNGEVYCGYGSGATCGGIKVDDKGLPNGRVTVALEKGVVYTNDVVWSDAHRSDATFSVEYNLYLFAQNRKGTAKPGDGQGDIICHGCTISEGSVVKRDFVPCVRESDLAVGLYDLAESDPSKAFYTNAGSGAFGVPDGTFCTVTVGALAHMTAAYTFGDGSVTNAVDGTTFKVLAGTKNLTVIFTAVDGYQFADDSTEKIVTRDVVTGDIDLTAETPVAHKVQPMATITKITNRYPWNGKIDVEYELKNVESVFGPIDALVTKFTSGDIEVTRTTDLSDAELATRTVRRTYDCRDLFGDGKQDVQAQSSAKLVTLLDYNYAVIDISDGANATSYPVTYYEEAPEEGWNKDEYKTSKIVLYYVKEGKYWGNQKTEQTTTGFWIGVFEITEAQYAKVMGAGNSTTKPKASVSYTTLRGTDMPDEPVTGDSFLKRLCDRTGLDGFDLPTESQWEIACRAGTTTDYYWGDSMYEAYRYMWYSGNSSSTQEVGQKKPNAWGLYDMAGNVWEWCRDGYHSPLTVDSSADVCLGPAAYGNYLGRRVQRGGAFYSDASIGMSSSRHYDVAGNGLSDMGFRLSRMSSKGEGETAQSGVDENWRTGPNFRFDTRTEKTIAGTEAETISYSGDDWGAGGSGVKVEYSFDGGAAVELKTATDSGSVSWTPTLNGRYVFSHAVTDGTTETAVLVVNGFPGGEGNPWEIGTGVTAYVKDRVLYLNGEGEVVEFGGDGAPWAGYGETLTGIGPLSKGIVISASVLATLPISIGKDEPSGAIAPAEVERVKVAGGNAQLVVAVAKSSDPESANGWSQANISAAMVENGKVRLTVPADFANGYMILKTKDAESTSGGVKSAQTVGMLSVQNSAKQAAVGVPFGKIGGHDGQPDQDAVSVAEVLGAMELAEGDLIHVYDKGTSAYQSWAWTGSAWAEANTVVENNEVLTAPEAGSVRLPRGSAFWLERANTADLTKPIILAGRYVAGDAPAPTIGVGWNLVGNAKAGNFNFSAVMPKGANDKIIVPTGGAPKIYTYDANGWGYAATKEVKIGSRTMKLPYRETTDNIIPAGHGFWYVSEGNE